MTIATKIFEIMKLITTEQDLPKLRESLITQNLITRKECEIANSSERVDIKGVVWQVVTVLCRLKVIDSESGEGIENTALGTGIDTGVMAVVKAQDMALRRVWLGALGITEAVAAQDVALVPEIVVETPESKLRDQINALWRWDRALFADYFMKRFGRPLEQLNITELTATKAEFENHRG